MHRGRCDASLRSCRCVGNFTLNDCSAPTFEGALQTLPYGQIFANECAYCGNDLFGDAHPLFNVSEVAQIRVSLSQADWDTMLDPSSIYNEPYFALDSMQLYNRAIDVVQPSSAAMHVKGYMSRRNLKKSWKFKIHGAGNDAVPKHLGLKADRAAFLNQLIAELYRSWPLPAPRGGFAQLWIRDVSMGFFWLEEQIDGQFLASRFKHSNGTLIKLVTHAYLRVIGNGTPEAYRDAVVPYRGSEQHVYKLEQADSAGNEQDAWSQLANFIRFVDRSSDAEFEQRIESLFDVESFLRLSALGAFFHDSDGYCENARNAFLYFEPAGGLVHLLRHDFDSQRLLVDEPASNWCKQKSQLCVRIKKVPRFQQRFYALLELLMDKVLASSAIMERIEQFGRYLAFDDSAADPGFDLLLRPQYLTSPLSPAYAAQLRDFIPQRIAFLRKEIEQRSN
jgi:CotH kinase protein